MKNHLKKTLGFTLIEMLVTISIVAILASIAVPSFSKMIERNRITSGTNEFLSALILTRSEAVKRSQTVTVCVSNAAQTACDTTSDDYAKGWLIFAECGSANGTLDTTTNICDTNNSGAVDSPEVPIKVHGELPQLSIKPDATDNEYLTYDISGRSDDLNLHVGKDSTTTNLKKTIDINRTGRATTCDYSATGC